jgi:hypothetical protein
MGLHKTWDKTDYDALGTVELFEMLSHDEGQAIYGRVHNAMTDCDIGELLELYNAFLEIQGREKEIDSEQKNIKEEIINYLEQ